MPCAVRMSWFPARPSKARSVGSCLAGLSGRTVAGRYLVVVFTVRQTRLRPVTAYTMNQAERGIYGSQID